MGNLLAPLQNAKILLTICADRVRLVASMETVPTASPRPRKVAVLVDLSLQGARTFLLHMAEWVRQNANWRFILQEGRAHEQTLDPIALRADGVYISGDFIDVIPSLRKNHIPFVVGDPLPNGWERLPLLRNMPVAKLNSRIVGEQAADYFLARRYASFAYVAETDNLSWSVERRDGFVSRLADAGFVCKVYDGFTRRERRSWVVERPRMVAWLKSLPKPTAIFAAMDGRARLVLDACAEAGIVVPNEIAVLGVDDDPVICETTYPRLSSVRTGGSGALAAQMLDSLMAGNPLSEHRQTQNPLSIVTRESTGHNAMSNPLLAKALLFIRDRGGAVNLTVSDVVAEMGCSRRLAEMLFAEQIGCTIKDELVRVKFNTVKRLLAETNLSVAAITERCGFSSESHLSRRFTALFGVTMSEWRREHA